MEESSSLAGSTESRPRRSPRTARSAPAAINNSRTRRRLSGGGTTIQDGHGTTSTGFQDVQTTATDSERFEKRLEWSLRYWRAYLQLNLTEFDSITYDDVRLLDRRLSEEVPQQIPLRLGFWGSSFEPEALEVFKAFLSDSQRAVDFMDVARAKLSYSEIAGLVRSAWGIRVFKFGIREGEKGTLEVLKAISGTVHGDESDVAFASQQTQQQQEQLEELTVVPHRYDESHVIKTQCLSEFVEALQPLNKTLKKLSLGERFTMRELSCNDDGLQVIVDALLGMTGKKGNPNHNNFNASSLQKLNLHLRGGLTDAALGSLSRLFLGLPQHITLNFSLLECPDLFANAKEQDTEVFMRGLEQCVCSIGSFKLVSVGVKGRSAARLFTAIEKFQNCSSSKRDCSECVCEIIGNGILSDPLVLQQLEKSIPRMQGIDRFTVEELSQQLNQHTWKDEQTEKLLDALDNNPQLDDLDLIMAGRYRPLRHSLRFEQRCRRIYQRNVHLRKLKRKVQNLSCEDDSSKESSLPIGALPHVLNQIGNLPPRFGVSPLYSLVKRHVGSMTYGAVGIETRRPEARPQRGSTTPRRKRLATQELPCALPTNCRTRDGMTTPPRKISRQSALTVAPLRSRKPRRVQVGII